MVELRYSPAASRIVAGGLQNLYPPLFLGLIEEEFCRVLLELGRNCNQDWLQRYRVITDGQTQYLVLIKTPTGVDGDLAIFWWPIAVGTALYPYVGAIVPGYKS